MDGSEPEARGQPGRRSSAAGSKPEATSTIDWQRTLALAGVGVIGGGALLGSVLWIVRQRDILNVKVTHIADPAFVAKYGPMLERGIDVNMHLFSKREGGAKGAGGSGGEKAVTLSLDTVSTGYDAGDTSSSRRGGSMSAHLLDAFGATAVAEAEALISEMDGPELPDDDRDLLGSVLGSDDDDVGSDVGDDDDDILPPGMARVPGMTAWNVQDMVTREVGVAGVSGMGFGEDDGVGRVSFKFQSPIELTVDRAVSSHPMPRQHQLEVLRAIPYMSTGHLVRIVRNPRRSKKVHAAARAELSRRQRGGRAHAVQRDTFPATHQDWRPGAHWQGHAWPTWHRQVQRPPARPSVRPPARPPAARPGHPSYARPPAARPGHDASPDHPSYVRRPPARPPAARPGHDASPDHPSYVRRPFRRMGPQASPVSALQPGLAMATPGRFRPSVRTVGPMLSGVDDAGYGMTVRELGNPMSWTWGETALMGTVAAIVGGVVWVNVADWRQKRLERASALERDQGHW